MGPANELRYEGSKLITRHLRIGFDENGSWRLFALRKDFVPASKLLAEDDITASTVAPINLLNNIGPGNFEQSAKFIHNCEYRSFNVGRCHSQRFRQTNRNRPVPTG